MLRYMQHMMLVCLCALPLLAGLQACTATDDAQRADEAERTKVSVVFSIVLQESTTLTRATNVDWGDYDPTDVGLEQESNIDLETLQVGIYDENNRRIGTVEKLAAQRVRNADGTTAYYRVQGGWTPTDAEQLAAAKKLMIVANATATTADLGSLQFTTTESGTTTANLGYIPMWGVAPISAALELGTSTDLGEISMLRSMAKVLVQLTDEMVEQGYTIESVQLNNHNEQGYVLPQGYANVSNTRELTFSNTPRYLSSLSTAALSFALPEAATSKQCSQNLYLPEYENSAATATPATITVTLARNGTVDGTYTFGFYEYSDDGKAQTAKPVDIVRNHFYLFSIYKNTNNVKVNLSVRQWRKFTHDNVVM